jgi:hypothetical protein
MSGIWSRIFGGGGAAGARAEEAVERVVQLANPKLRLARRYRARLAPAVQGALDYIAKLVAALPGAREASSAAWAADPYIHAFFARPEDLLQAFSRAGDLRAHFERHPGASEAYGVLGMEMTERRVLGTALEGEAVLRGVAQTTVSFADHRVRICAESEHALRRELERRLLDQLALEALGRTASDEARRTELEQERALLKTRVRLLERQGAGMRAALAGDAPASAELARLQAGLEENTKALDALGVGSQALGAELERLRAILADPSQYLFVSRKSLRLDRLNVVAEGGAALDFEVARVPGDPPLTRAFALVRIPRSALLPRGQLLDDAARLLA